LLAIVYRYVDHIDGVKNKGSGFFFILQIIQNTYLFFSTEIKEGQVRCGEHSDYGTLTLLFQDLIGGLEVNMSLYLIIDIDLYIKKDEMRGAQLNGQVI
jgi:hypothetical protein